MQYLSHTSQKLALFPKQTHLLAVAFFAPDQKYNSTVRKQKKQKIHRNRGEGGGGGPDKEKKKRKKEKINYRFRHRCNIFPILLRSLPYFQNKPVCWLSLSSLPIKLGKKKGR